MAVQVKNISVSFPGVKALQNVSMEFKPGQIHAVVGANGSGKSTLVKVLTGVYKPDSNCGSEIIIGDVSTKSIDSPIIASSMGIRVVHQESPLVKTFTVGECVALFEGYPKRNGKIDWKALNKNVKDLFRIYDINVDPDLLTEDLTASERNMIAMAIAMGRDEKLKKTKVLILDEADASIPEAEAEKFLVHVRKIADMGIPVIMVTHRMKSVMKFCDDVFVLNDGKLVYQGLISETSEDLLVSKMMKQDDSESKANAQAKKYTLGNLWDALNIKAPESTNNEVLSMTDVYAENIDGLTFSVKQGEILGIIGIKDSGVVELPKILGGELRISKGSYKINGKEVSLKATPRSIHQSGLSLLPCDRPVNSSIMPLTLKDNVLLPNEFRFWHRSTLSKNVMKMVTDIFDVIPGHDINMMFGKFSGGNQQKAILAKWLLSCPSVFVLDDPTYGVDPASRMRIFEKIREAAEKKVAIIIFSTEPEQLANVCSRIIALRNGKVAGELKGDELTREAIARWCYI